METLTLIYLLLISMLKRKENGQKKVVLKEVREILEIKEIKEKQVLVDLVELKETQEKLHGLIQSYLQLEDMLLQILLIQVLMEQAK